MWSVTQKPNPNPNPNPKFDPWIEFVSKNISNTNPNPLSLSVKKKTVLTLTLTLIGYYMRSVTQKHGPSFSLLSVPKDSSSYLACCASELA